MNGFREEGNKMSQSAFPSSLSTMNLSNHNTVTHSSTCCLMDNGQRCTRTAGNASYSKRIEKTVAQRKLHLSIDHRAGHAYICEYHKGIIQSIRTGKRKRKDSDDDNSNDMDGDSSLPDVDLLSLQVNTLRRYKRHYRIQTRPGLNKSQLAEVCIRLLYRTFSERLIKFGFVTKPTFNTYF